ncbi:MAG: nucleotide exchange factor GrpE [Anaerolineae bacterium]|nr:nucleotide exchange factor GrpE [Anaerolineae bacterium]NUQ05880.1 nucleotide exchange factor GrpE [Anaerolineae bacterium]
MTNSETQTRDDAEVAQTDTSGADSAERTPTQDAAPASDAPVQKAEGETVTLEAYQKLQEQADQYREGWQRERAEFANYQRRIERDMKASRDNATGDAFKAVLPVLDDFERAMGTVPTDLAENAWVNGVAMILRKFYRVLENNSVTILDPTGQPFDPSRHEAIGTDDNPEFETGTVTVTLQKGYLVGDRVLRPALVRVAQ